MTKTENTIVIDGILFTTGIRWISALATINVFAQQLSPALYRGGFLSINTTVSRDLLLCQVQDGDGLPVN